MSADYERECEGCAHLHVEDDEGWCDVECDPDDCEWYEEDD